MGNRRTGPTAVCPAHTDSRVVSKGKRKTKQGDRSVFRCTPVDGKRHTFTVVMAGPVPVPLWSPPPPCPLHEGTRVVRDGRYASTTERARQRYRCYPNPTDRTVYHRFTPWLPREHVHTGKDSCEACEELRGTHRGEASVSRRHSWSARSVAEGLRNLARGAPAPRSRRWRGRRRTEPGREPHPQARRFRRVQPRRGSGGTRLRTGLRPTGRSCGTKSRPSGGPRGGGCHRAGPPSGGGRSEPDAAGDRHRRAAGVHEVGEPRDGHPERSTRLLAARRQPDPVASHRWSNVHREHVNCGFKSRRLHQGNLEKPQDSGSGQPRRSPSGGASGVVRLYHRARKPGTLSVPPSATRFGGRWHASSGP